MATTLHEHALGLTWVLDEPMRRASHALVDEGRVWLVDPVDDAAALERVAGLGEVVGVIQLLDRHNRDCAQLAARFDVSHSINPRALPGAPFAPFSVVDGLKWKETALWWSRRRGLVIAEAIATHKLATGGRPAGVHLMLRLRPPRRTLGGYRPEHLLVGHGPPIDGPAAAALQGALDGTLRNLPRALIGAFRDG